MDHYLAHSEVIDWQTELVLRKAIELKGEETADEVIAKACFEFVRDQIKHSWDFQLGPVTCKASEVLRHGTGFCYAKSHLLAALLRANQIPVALCYQRLTVSDVPPFCVHGLNAVFLQKYGWYRVDARGNKPGVAAKFSPPQETLAFPIVTPGEADLPERWSEPMPLVLEALQKYENIQDLADNLPDIAIN